MEELNDSFSKTAEKRLSAKFDAAQEKKDQQYKELQDRLKEHVSKIICDQRWMCEIAFTFYFSPNFVLNVFPVCLYVRIIALSACALYLYCQLGQES